MRPIPEGQAPPEVVMPKEFLKQGAATAPRTPGVGVTGVTPVVPMMESVPVEQLDPSLQGGQGKPASAPTTYQLVPVAPAAPAAEPPAAAPAPKQGNGGL